jgi:hypothetical protein
MDISTRTCGFGTMILGGIMQGVALLSVAFVQEPFPMALILLGVGILLFLVGAVLCGQRGDHSY